MKNIQLSGLRTQTTKDVSVKYAPFFVVKNVYFRGNCRYAFVNAMKYDMGLEAVEEDGTMLAPLSAVEKIYGPEMKVEMQNEEILVTYNKKQIKLQNASNVLQLETGEECVMEKPVQYMGEELYVPVENLMCMGFAKASDWNANFLVPGDYLGIGDKKEEIFPDRYRTSQMNTQLTKDCGVMRKAYYFEAGNRIMPYIVYVPTTYSPEKPSKLAVYLHGAGGGVGESRELEFVPGAFETAAEKHNYILLMPEGYATGFYGGYSPKVNPEDAPEEEKPYIELCESETLNVINRVKKEFNIDESNVFLFGNSMGGAGTFYLGKKYNTLFRAIAPCGCLHDIDLKAIDMSPLKDSAVLFVMGTENQGIEELPRMVREMREMGVDTSSVIAPGRYHKDGYCYCMEEIFEFFDKYSC